jgi:hypothetical protein
VLTIEKNEWLECLRSAVWGGKFQLSETTCHESWNTAVQVGFVIESGVKGSSTDDEESKRTSVMTLVSSVSVCF